MKRFCIAMMIALCSYGPAIAQGDARGDALRPAAEDLVWITIGEDAFDTLLGDWCLLSKPSLQSVGRHEIMAAAELNQS